MQRLKYQIKNIRGNKMCIVTFLLPVIVGIAINLLSGIDVQNIGEISSGTVENSLSSEASDWLKNFGNVTEYGTVSELKNEINNPSTQMIGVLETENGIHTILSGDELKLYKTAADILPQMYGNRAHEKNYSKNIVPVPSNDGGLKSILAAITLVTAMFMGCTFNAMNIIGEKEDGVAFINKILPMTGRTYISQKVILGFIGGFLSTAITAFICMKIEAIQLLPLIFLIILSAYIASLIGLFIGYFSSGLMVGIVYIKIVMIMFLAPPIVFYLMISANSTLYPISYLIPSSAAFYGIMDLLNGQSERLWLNIAVLIIHSVLLSCLYLFLHTKKKSN